MDEMTCPHCQQAMTGRTFAGATVAQCDGCEGVFLPRSSLSALVEAERDWHSHRSAHTAPIPRITEDMTAPPPSVQRSKSFLDSLFRA